MVASNEIEKEYFEKLKKHIRYNYQIADFYIDRYLAEGAEIPDELSNPKEIEEYFSSRSSMERAFGEAKRAKWLSKSRNIFYCCKYWDIEKYFKLRIKDIKRVNRCRDKFCFNCQKSMALERQAQFVPQLDEYRKDYEVFHLIMTVPNCTGKELSSVIDRMYKKFRHLIRYLAGDKKVKGIDFLSYGYAGAVRGLEVTQNQDDKLFHPHFHCMVLFKKGLKLEKTIINPYSFNRGVLENKFSALEILLQKIWFLLLNDERVTAKRIEELKLGYDVKLEDSDGYYHEAFKYACKGCFDEDKGLFLYNEQTFWTLYEALHNRRMIQGYGLLYNFDECGDVLDGEADYRYEVIIHNCKEFENPTFQVEELDDIIKNSWGYRYISRANVKRFLEGQRKEIEEKFILLGEGLTADFFDKPE
ncbi:MAG: protein rep [Clostridia bacterium]|nr:protein rep [Clostridia bacterium]